MDEMIDQEEIKTMNDQGYSKNVESEFHVSDESDQTMQKRQAWLKQITLANREEMLFELEMNLKAIDRFFNLNNHEFSTYDTVLSRDFLNELKVVHTAIQRVILITGDFLHQKTKNLYYFERYILDKLLEDFSRDIHVRKGISQTVPEESLHTLRLGFVNLRNIITILEHLGSEVKYIEFHSIGQLISREIARNVFFNPLDNKPFLPEFDRIGNQHLSRIILQLRPAEFKKKTSILLLIFYRLLHYLDYVKPDVTSMTELKSSLIFFVLINSEYRIMLHFLEQDYQVAIRRFMETDTKLSLVENNGSENVAREINTSSYNDLVDSLLYQMRMEIKNVNRRVLRDLMYSNDETRLRSGIENAKGILTNLLQQIIVCMSQEFDPSIKGDDIFTVFVSRLHQSLMLRRDIWMFRELMSYFEERIETVYTEDPVISYMEYLNALHRFIAYFYKNAYLLLRFEDAFEFQKFFEGIYEFKEPDLSISYKLESFKLSAKYFKIFLDTMLGNISNRAELCSVPFDEKQARVLLLPFLSTGDEIA